MTPSALFLPGTPPPLETTPNNAEHHNMSTQQLFTDDPATSQDTVKDTIKDQHTATRLAAQAIASEPQAYMGMRYAKVFETKKLGAYQSFLASCGEFFGRVALVPCCCCANPWKEVQQGRVGLITQFGELSRVVEPGATYVNTFSEKLRTVVISTQVQDVPEQACLTKDNVIVYLKSVIYYNIVDPQRAIFGITDINSAVSERTQTTLRDVIGSRVLQDVIERREEIAEAIQHIIREVATEWGVLIESILIKDLRLSPEITQALSQAAQAKRIGESKIITAKAEVESAKLMRQAADILASKPAMQIRYLDAMQQMARSANSKVIFMPSSGEIGKSAETASGANDALTSGGAHGQEFTAEDASKIIALNEAFEK